MNPFYLPVPPPPPDVPDATAQQWMQAVGGPGPSTDSKADAPSLGHGGSVALYRTGPGDYGSVDQWMGEDIFVVPREGVMNGEQLFDKNQWQPPNEGHGEYGFAQDGPKIDHSTRTLALFWSDWYSSTAANAGGGGSFRGEHVVIERAVPGSAQGYMPVQMEQLNTLRNQPGPWDQQLLVGREDYLASMRAATSMPSAGVNG